MTRILFFFALILVFLSQDVDQAVAQTRGSDIVPIVSAATESAEVATPSALDKPLKIEQDDLTKPEEAQVRQEFLALFKSRPINEPDLLNFMGFMVQYAVRTGVPANTIILILLTPALATLVVIFRHIIGIQTLELLVPIALAVTFVATGIVVGTIILVTILIGSIVARIILRRIRIMQLPKMALSMFMIAIFVFFSLVVSASLGLFAVNELSFLPVLLLILLSDKIVGLQLAKGVRATITITAATLVVAAVGYFVLSLNVIRSFILLYPEVSFLLIPINIVLGRYFGLRLTEFHRFASLRKYGNQ